MMCPDCGKRMVLGATIPTPDFVEYVWDCMCCGNRIFERDDGTGRRVIV